MAIIGFKPRIAATAAAALLLCACGRSGSQGETPAPAPSVTVVAAVSEEIKPTITFTGRVQAQDKVELRARIDGFLQKRLFEEGQDVKVGDLLFVIEQEAYKATVAETKANIEKAQASGDARQSRVRPRLPPGPDPGRNAGATRRGDRQAGRGPRRARPSQGRARQGRAAAELHRNPRAGRRADRPLRLFGRQLREPAERAARDHRAAGSDLRRLSRHRARDARGAQGGDRTASTRRSSSSSPTAAAMRSPARSISST